MQEKLQIHKYSWILSSESKTHLLGLNTEELESERMWSSLELSSVQGALI